MARITTVAPDQARGLRKLLVWMQKRSYGVFPGVGQIFLADLRVGLPLSLLYDYLHLRRSSPLTRLQREMVATVVNGTIGGAP